MDTPLIDAAAEYVKEKNVPFSMPGHKNGRAFNFDIKGIEFSRLLIEGDLTEVDGLDNLQKPEGPIKESLELLRKAYGTKKSYFLVNGSTSGNLAMIFSSFSEGDKVLVDRGCHKSVFNGIIMRKLQPVYILPKIDKNLNIPLSVTFDDVKKAVLNESDIKGIILTYPTYYGISCDFERIAHFCSDRGIKVIADSAHGAHFGFNKRLPENPIKLGADMAVVSAHKTLPSLTQTAYLNAGENADIESLDFYVQAFSTTSPSYMFMMSLDFARAYMSEYGEKKYDELIEMINDLRKKLKSHDIFRVLCSEDLPNGFSMDPSRVIINCKNGFSGHKTLKYLRKRNIQCEMSDNSNVVIIPSPFSNDSDFNSLYKALIECPHMEVMERQPEIMDGIIGETCMMPYEAALCKKKKVFLKDAEGLIAGSCITPYPPGIPVIMMGEKILLEQIDIIESYINSGVQVLGCDDGKIEAVCV